ncbi:YolD-like family protein [Pseudalkalibacillus hwajinpoensis]|uniref:YolD-like family protein n=1 Tax=Guptibacillus hwajinpoensis TaxID=208199 RepID=UPI00325A9FA7
MIRDRGNIKWTSMMLPEHVKELRGWKAAERKEDKPVLDEQKIEEINEVICEAMAFHRPLYFYYFKDGETYVIHGYVHYFDQLNREFRIIDDTEKKRRIPLTDLVHVEAR